MSVLPIIALGSWTVLCFVCGYLTCYRKYAAFSRDLGETDAILDRAQDHALEAKDETIGVLRGLVYAMADEQHIE